MSKTRSGRGLGKLTTRQLRIFCVLLIVANLLAVILLSVGVFSHRWQLRKQQTELSDQLGINAQMDAEQVEEQYAIAVGEASRKVSLYNEVTVCDGMVPLWLSNDDDNSCAVAVTLELVGSGKVLAQSRPIDPGWHLENLEMEETLAPGQYQCLARCTFYTMEDDLLLGQTVRQVLLTVE